MTRPTNSKPTTILPRILCLALGAFACGGGGDDGGGGGGDAGPPGPDATPITEDICGFDSDRVLPFAAGFGWTYQVTDLDTGAKATKEQSLVADDDPTYGEVLVQTTGKLDGSTRSLLKVDGDRVVRLLQEDLDAGGTLERTTTYDPGQIRIDESTDRLVTGATWEEAYDETETEAGTGPVTVATVDAWEVIDEKVLCEGPIGAFECVHLRRTRTAGGVAVKDFFFARGVGKVREVGDNQLEELAGCEAE